MIDTMVVGGMEILLLIVFTEPVIHIFASNEIRDSMNCSTTAAASPCQGFYKQMTSQTCLGGVMTLDCGVNFIHLTAIRYGRWYNSYCESMSGKPSSESSCLSEKAADTGVGLCENRNKCSIMASYIGNNPCPETVYSVEADYICATNAQYKQDTVVYDNITMECNVNRTIHVIGIQLGNTMNSSCVTQHEVLKQNLSNICNGRTRCNTTLPFNKYCPNNIQEYDVAYKCAIPCLCNLSNTLTCLTETGVCICKDGFKGPTCNLSCRPWIYGKLCSRSCRCNIANTEYCSNVDGTCKCKPGWIGDLCENAHTSSVSNDNKSGPPNAAAIVLPILAVIIIAIAIAVLVLRRVYRYSWEELRDILLRRKNRNRLKASQLPPLELNDPHPVGHEHQAHQTLNRRTSTFKDEFAKATRIVYPAETDDESTNTGNYFYASNINLASDFNTLNGSEASGYDQGNILLDTRLSGGMYVNKDTFTSGLQPPEFQRDGRRGSKTATIGKRSRSPSPAGRTQPMKVDIPLPPGSIDVTTGQSSSVSSFQISDRSCVKNTEPVKADNAVNDNQSSSKNQDVSELKPPAGETGNSTNDTKVSGTDLSDEMEASTDNSVDKVTDKPVSENVDASSSATENTNDSAASNLESPDNPKEILAKEPVTSDHGFVSTSAEKPQPESSDIKQEPNEDTSSDKIENSKESPQI